MDVQLTLFSSDLHLCGLLIYNHRANAGRSLSHLSVLFHLGCHPVKRQRLDKKTNKQTKKSFLLLWLAEMSVCDLLTVAS